MDEDKCMLYYIPYVCILQWCGFGPIWVQMWCKTEMYQSVNIFWPQHVQFYMVDLESHACACHYFKMEMECRVNISDSVFFLVVPYS